MKPLTTNEISFMVATKWTPTKHQMDYAKTELSATPYAGLNPEDAKLMYENAAKGYGIDLDELFAKTSDIDNADGISLEYEAVYLFCTFFTRDQIYNAEFTDLLDWLRDFKYYGGFRKWDLGYVATAAAEAMEIFDGSRVFYLEEEGNVWNIEKDSQFIIEHPELIYTPESEA